MAPKKEKTAAPKAAKPKTNGGVKKGKTDATTAPEVTRKSTAILFLVSY